MLKILKKFCRIKNTTVREMLSEFVATFFLVVFAIGSGAQHVLSKQQLSSYLTLNCAGGMGLALGVYFGGGVSGGFVNPAVTLGFCLSERIPWRKWPTYVLAQLCGAFCAAAVNYGIYLDAINIFDGGKRSTTGVNATAGIFSTFPRDSISSTTALFNEVFATFVLVAGSLAITDDNNMLPHKGLIPLALGSIVFAIGSSFGFNTGYAINPARDLAPRAFTAIAGWGSEPFTHKNYYFWIPVVGPMIGGFLASIFYSLFIEIHWPDEDARKTTKINTGQNNNAFQTDFEDISTKL